MTASNTPGDDPAPRRRAAPQRWLRAPFGAVAAAVLVLDLLYLYTQAPAARAGTHAALAAFVLMGLAFFRLREFYLLAVASALTAVAALTGAGGLATVLNGFDQAAFLVTFIMVLKLLETGATSSEAILAAGTYLTRQPPGRRFAGLALGAHLLGVIVNLGTVSLLAPLVQRGVREGLKPGEALDELGRVRERRQLTALVRGFSWMVIWSPTAVAPAVLLTLLPGIDAARLVALGLCLAAIILAVGWIEDRIRWLPFRRRLIREGRLPAVPAMAFPAGHFAQLLLVCMLLAGLTVLFSFAGGVKIVPGLMLAAPVAGTGWIAIQCAGSGAGRMAAATAARLGQFAGETMPATAPIAMTLAASGYIGTLAAALVPAETLAGLLHSETVPGWAFLALLPLLLVLTGHLAVSPIMMAVFFGSILGAMPQLPAEPTLVALALSCGWALSMSATPFASVVLLTAQTTGIPATTLTWRWNLPFALAAALVLAAAFYVLTGGR